MQLVELRQAYHQEICKKIIRFKKNREGVLYPNFADAGNRSSIAIATGMVELLGCQPASGTLAGQSTGGRFELLTKDFLERAMASLQHLRPGDWMYSIQANISEFDQYEHLASLAEIVKETDTLAAALGMDYIVKPDIVMGRQPLVDAEINRNDLLVGEEILVCNLSPLRVANNPYPILHASISCKWTLRSDRSQNARTEALNLVRNRKGGLPHIVAVTAEPLPTRLAALALGTGDLDCVYHFALPELQAAIAEADNQDQGDMLDTLIAGRRLRDISDLPFDLAV